MNKTRKLLLLFSSCLAVLISLSNAYSQSDNQKELYDECVRTAGTSLCDFLFKRNTNNTNNLTDIVQSNYTEPTNSTSGSWNTSSPLNSSPLNSTYSTYDDKDLGFTIQYPSDWTIDKTNSQHSTVASFDSPQKDASVNIRIFPKGDFKSIKEYGDKNFKESEDQTLLGYYRNSSTLLSGKPAFRAIYLTTYKPSLFENAFGYQSSTSKAMFTATMVPEKKSIYALVYFSNPTNFDNNLPVIEKMIDSFKISGKGPIIQEDDSSSSTSNRTTTNDTSSDELYDECLSVSSKSVCDFLFKK